MLNLMVWNMTSFQKSYDTISLPHCQTKVKHSFDFALRIDFFFNAKMFLLLKVCKFVKTRILIVICRFLQTNAFGISMCGNNWKNYGDLQLHETFYLGHLLGLCCVEFVGI
jgi:hypothetical protein